MSSVCRVCCAGGDDRNLYTTKNKKIIQAFEKITDLKFVSAGRPTEICSFCCTWLLRCTTMSEMARKSEKIFNELFVKGLKVTHAAIEKLNLAKVQYLSVNPVKILCLNDRATEGNCTQIFEEVSVKVERLEEPQETESAVGDFRITIHDEESNDFSLLEPNHSSAHSTATKPADQSANYIERKEIYCCDICKKKIYSRQKFIPHVRTHEQSKIYCCDMCTKKYTTRKRIVAHIKRHYPKKFNICNLSEPADQSANYVEPKEIYCCDICKKKFYSRQKFVPHVRTHEQSKIYCCDMCKKKYTIRKRIVAHIKIHNPKKLNICNSSEPADQSANYVEPKEIYCCDICKKKFYSRQKFVPHVRTHEQSKIYCCDMCTKKFTTRKRIVAHIKRHYPKKLNICNICGRKLSTKGNLSRHMNVHTGQKPFKCDKCNILFTQKSHLRRHISAIRHRTGKKYCKVKKS